MAPLRVAAIVLIRDRRVLMVTSRGRDVYYMPGGKIEAGETLSQAAAREAHEEVSLTIDPNALRELFSVRTQAHGEPEGRKVHMHLFLTDTAEVPLPAAEVDAIHWVASSDMHRLPPAGRETVRELVRLDLID